MINKEYIYGNNFGKTYYTSYVNSNSFPVEYSSGGIFDSGYIHAPYIPIPPTSLTPIINISESYTEINNNIIERIMGILDVLEKL